jgi:hypothetical protein
MRLTSNPQALWRTGCLVDDDLSVIETLDTCFRLRPGFHT